MKENENMKVKGLAHYYVPRAQYSVNSHSLSIIESRLKPQCPYSLPNVLPTWSHEMFNGTGCAKRPAYYSGLIQGEERRQQALKSAPKLGLRGRPSSPGDATGGACALGPARPSGLTQQATLQYRVKMASRPAGKLLATTLPGIATLNLLFLQQFAPLPLL